ncbi:hypothetical protein IKF15_00180 [Candidatus Saccharibacteria bacterium]|nr:hypothetical protein [Candidatus Saccharibacteria bacterium]
MKTKTKVKIKMSEKTIEKLRNKISSAYQIPEGFLFPKYHFGEAFSLGGKELDIFTKSVDLKQYKGVEK